MTITITAPPGDIIELNLEGKMADSTTIGDSGSAVLSMQPTPLQLDRNAPVAIVDLTTPADSIQTKLVDVIHLAS